MTVNSRQWQERINQSCEPHSHDFFIVAKIDNNSIGIVGAEKKSDTIWTLKEVYVRDKYRGQGIGRRLLEAIIWKLDHQYSAQIIELRVNTRQEAAINLYKKCGFSIVSTIENQESGDGNRYTKFNMCRKRSRVHVQSLEQKAFLTK